MNARAQDCNENISISDQRNINLAMIDFSRSDDLNGFRLQPGTVNSTSRLMLPNLEIHCPCGPAPAVPRRDLQPYMVPNPQLFYHQQFNQPQYFRLDRPAHQQQFNQPLHFPDYQPFPGRQSEQQPYLRPSNPCPDTGDQSRFWDGYWRSYWSNYFKLLGEDPRYAPAREPERQPESLPLPDSQRNDADLPRRRRQPHVPANDRPEIQPRPQPTDRRQNPEGPPGGRQDIVRHARESVGQALFRFIPGTPGRLGCAASVSAALNKAGFNYARHAGVGGLTQILMRNGWTRHEGIQNARPGDVVVVARRAGWENGGGGSHIGIVGENGKVYHNSSGRQQWIEDSLQRVFGGGMMRFILRPPNR